MHGPTRRQEYSASTRRALVDVRHRAVHRAGLRRHQPRRDRRAAPGSPRARSTTTSPASRRSSRPSSRRSRTRPPSTSGRPSASATRGRGARSGSVRSWRSASSRRFRRIVMQEGPAVLGFERFREPEERSTFGLVQRHRATGARPLRPPAEHRRDVHPGLLRRDDVGRRPRSHRPRTPQRPDDEVETVIGTSWPACVRWPSPGPTCPDRPTCAVSDDPDDTGRRPRRRDADS